jgi:MFS transporter, putative metabolite:H+ symporter
MLVPWREAYIIGGVLGFLLLFLRMKTMESSLFESSKLAGANRGQFFALFTSWNRFSRYLSCLSFGMPTWFGIGILVTFSPEIGRALEIQGDVKASYSVMACYFGLSIGDFASGWISHALKSRKKAAGLFMTGATCVIGGLLMLTGQTPTLYYVACGLLGLFLGYWAIFVTVAAEQFGTNLRATVATTVPNFARALVVPFTLGFQALGPQIGVRGACAVLGAVAMTCAFFGLSKLRETWGLELNYSEDLS